MHGPQKRQRVKDRTCYLQSEPHQSLAELKVGHRPAAHLPRQAVQEHPDVPHALRLVRGAGALKHLLRLGVKGLGATGRNH